MSKLLCLFAILAVTSFAQSYNPKNQSGISQTQKPELVVQTGHSGWVWSVAFSPDRKTLASGSADNTIKLWEVSTGTELRTLKGHSGSVDSVAFSPDGKTLASSSADYTTKLWDVSTGTELRTLKGLRDSIVFRWEDSRQREFGLAVQEYSRAVRCLNKPFA